MSNERYKKLTSLDINYYEDNIPIEIDKGVILLDTITNQVLLQLKLRNLSNKIISFVEVEVLCFDLTGEKSSEDNVVHYMYQDFKANPKCFFGDRHAIKLLGENTRSVIVYFKKVMFNDGDILNIEQMKRYIRPEVTNINSLNNDLIQETKSINLSSNYAEIINLPKELDSEKWVCSCGRVNTDEKKCIRCEREKEKQLTELTVDNLSRLAQETKILKQREAEEEQRLKAEKRDAERKKIETERLKREEEFNRQALMKKKSRTRLIIRSSVIGIATSVSIFLGSSFIINEGGYQEANKFYEEGEYFQAMDMFTDLGGYRNSKEMLEDIIKFKFTFTEGYAPVLVNGKYAYMDENYNLKTEPIYEEAYYFQSGIAQVKIGGEYVNINQKFTVQESR